MVKIVSIEKNGTLKETNVRKLLKNEIYKKCGFKTDEHFKERACWNVKIDGEENVIKCFAKDEGRANMENKYDLPPPIDSALYFGTIAVVKMEGDEFKDLTIDLWNKVYEKLFGGFEDLAATAEEDEKEVDELDSVPEEMKTKHGYLKDGFVVDSEEDEDDEDEDAEEEDSWGDEGSELDYEEYEYSDDE
tara:strand:+ start:3696 stop:4265 length:570 start_codon:yes stop_codon:yes gene_type:complete